MMNSLSHGVGPIREASFLMDRISCLLSVLNMIISSVYPDAVRCGAFPDHVPDLGSEGREIAGPRRAQISFLVNVEDLPRSIVIP